MRNLKSIFQPLFSFAIAIAFLTSCQNLDSQEEIQSGDITDEVKAQFTELGFDVSDITLVEKDNPLTGEVGGYDYLLEGDIIISPDQLQDMLKSDIHHLGAVGEQYRTFNLVGGLPRNINVIGYTGGSLALDSKMRTALQWSIANFNRLNTGLNFTLTFGTNWQPYDIVVYRTSGGGGGSAGFPSGGEPYQFVQIQSGTSNFDTNVVEHVITHEIGHCVGLRHTDYFNRSLSCGTGGNEGSGGVGAVYIPGTPEGFDPNSIMLACFSTSEDGEFGPFDEVALEFLY
jgi:hypothetical protein